MTSRVSMDCRAFRDWTSFHSEFSRVFGFPASYGNGRLRDNRRWLRARKVFRIYSDIRLPEVATTHQKISLTPCAFCGVLAVINNPLQVPLVPGDGTLFYRNDFVESD
ncbi:barstar family protein [Edaphobacter sp. HDX4]